MNLLSKHETRRRLLRGMPDSDMLSSQVAHWLQSPQGEAVLLAEKKAIHAALEKLFGYHILQLGFSEEHSLIEQSPVGHKIIFSPSLRAGSTRAVASNEALPGGNLDSLSDLSKATSSCRASNAEATTIFRLNINQHHLQRRQERQ